jgi:two-component system, cell cycle response regulator
VLSGLKPGHSGIVYYDKSVTVTDFAGVPVLEGPHLRGVLIVDRLDNKPFDEADVDVMKTIAEEIVRAVQVERIFAEMDRDKFQRERFYEASREFNSARNVKDVADRAMSAAKRVAQVELVAVAVATEREGRLKVAAADWQNHPEARDWLNREFGAEEGLVGAAIKARHPLPHGTARSPSQQIFGPAVELQLPSVKVMPLLWNEQGIGALILGSSRPDFLPNDDFDRVRVIADHAAIAMANAQMYERMERMATTDGLTGLVNHRHFQEVFDNTLALAERHRRKVSLILTDIDHFKTVNDTYGHPVGDKVLKRVAAILGQQARRTDIVARYGGEEFAVLMVETDKVGAKHIAERIRKSVEAETFHSENGSFRSTLSLGIATFPDDFDNKAKVIQAADQALYTAKRSGRNRVVVHDQKPQLGERPGA